MPGTAAILRTAAARIRRTAIPGAVPDAILAIASAVALIGDPDGAVADRQAEDCYRLIAQTVGCDPLKWIAGPDRTAAAVAIAFERAARRAS